MSLMKTRLDKLATVLPPASGPSCNELIRVVPLHIRAWLAHMFQLHKEVGTRFDPPPQIRQEIKAAMQDGQWSGTWTPASDAERSELVAWLEKSYRRIDAAHRYSGDRIGGFCVNAWTLLLWLRGEDEAFEHYEWIAIEVARKFRERFRHLDSEPVPASS
jgi:hypothetical protein